jgi:crossover junction endodeoxyribonuclease RuvC
LGIDPGTHRAGFGLVTLERGGYHPVRYGAWTYARTRTLPQRLKSLCADLSSLLENHRPDWVVVESIFYSKNVRTALSMGEGRGVALLAAENAGVRIAEYSPLEVKRAVVGNGSAAKSQVQHMVRRLLKLEQLPGEDAADALALALCHCHTLSSPVRTLPPSRRTWKAVLEERGMADTLCRRANKESCR